MSRVIKVYASGRKYTEKMRDQSRLWRQRWRDKHLHKCSGCDNMCGYNSLCCPSCARKGTRSPRAKREEAQAYAADDARQARINYYQERASAGLPLFD
jgi:hypothetical protein